jgi:hypothetical protein
MIGDLTSSTLILTSIILRFYVGGCAGSMKRMNELIAWLSSWVMLAPLLECRFTEFSGDMTSCGPFLYIDILYLLGSSGVLMFFLQIHRLFLLWSSKINKTKRLAHEITHWWHAHCDILVPNLVVRTRRPFFGLASILMFDGSTTLLEIFPSLHGMKSSFSECVCNSAYIIYIYIIYIYIILYII